MASSMGISRKCFYCSKEHDKKIMDYEDFMDELIDIPYDFVWLTIIGLQETRDIALGAYLDEMREKLEDGNYDAHIME